jgi:hypothetical protein
MTRKRYQTTEQRMSLLIRWLERGEVRAAIDVLFNDGPILASDFGFHEATDEDLAEIAAALLGQIRWLVERPEAPLIWTVEAPLACAFLVHQRRPVLGLVRPRAYDAAALRGAAQLLLALALRDVGFVNVVTCAAPDCAHRFIRFHKQTYCSPTCQKRDYMRTRRANERYARSRRKRQIRLVRQRRKGA